MSKPKLIRVTTVPSSLKILLKGQHTFMSKYYEVVGVSSKGDELNEVAQAEGIRVVSVEMTRTISPINDLLSVWRLYKLFRKEKPLIVHTHTPKAGIAGMLAAKFAGVNIRLHTVAGLPLMEARGVKRKILNAVEKLTYRCATGVYPNSKGLYDFILKEKFTTEEQLKVIANGSSNGIDIAHFNAEQVSPEARLALKQSLSIQNGDYVFVFVGRLVSDKGLNEMISAFKELSDLNPSVKLLLVGGTESELDPLQPETLQEMERNEGIISVGFQNDVRPYFAISDALVFPTYREGFPNVVMQAGAMGLPAIVTNINGCNEIIIEGENGTIIPTKDRDRLLDAMVTFVKGSYAEKENLCQKMIADRYEQSVIWEALLDEYKQQQKSVS
jgi:glycosyltransferase involved in cell wall biosynthesis